MSNVGIFVYIFEMSNGGDIPTKPNTMSKFQLAQQFADVLFEANSDGEWNLSWKNYTRPEDGNFLGLSIRLGSVEDEKLIACGSLCDLMDILFHVQRKGGNHFHITEVFQVIPSDIGLPKRVDLILEVAA